MPPAKKRKTLDLAKEANVVEKMPVFSKESKNSKDVSSPVPDTDTSTPAAVAFSANHAAQESKENMSKSVAEKMPAISEEPKDPKDVLSSVPDTDTVTPAAAGDIASKSKERQERFKALQARAKSSVQKNFKEAALESQRLATDPNLLASLKRKHAIASYKLLKADTEAAGEDFERKRAWDWTIEESERWDKRMNKKEAHRDDQAFQDYRQDSRKVYKRQIRDLKPDLDQYEREKMAAIDKAVASGGLEIVETDDGELVAVDKDGTFYSTADSTGFVENKPDKAAVDRLVADLQKAEETRLRKRRERGLNGEDGDVTYINEKNKQFNQKLARFYNKYTADIRDSFERGTMI